MVTGIEVVGEVPAEGDKAMVLRIEGSGQVSPNRLTSGRVQPAQVMSAAAQAISAAVQEAKDANTGVQPELLIVARLATGGYFVGSSTGDPDTIIALLDEMAGQLEVSR